MDNKDMKSLLKQARNAINEKDFEQALRLSKEVIQSDENNYNAWVFIGVASQETKQTDKAEKAFENAIKISPDEVLAWQGLCNLLEKQENHQKLFNSLLYLTKLLFRDKSKQIESLNKLVVLAEKIGNPKLRVEVLELQLEMFEGDSCKEYEIWQKMLQETCCDGVFYRDVKMTQTALEMVLHNPNFSENDCKEIFSSVIEPLCDKGKYTEAYKLADTIYLIHKTSRTCLLCFLTIILDEYIDTRKINNEEKLKQLLSATKEIGIYHVLCDILLSVLSLVAKQPLQAMKELKSGLANDENSWQGWFLLTKLQLQFHLYKDAETSARKGLLIASKPDVFGSFYLFLGQALAGCQNWDAALIAFEKCVEHAGRAPEILKEFCFALLEMGKVDQALNVYSELSCEISDQALLLQIEGYLHIKREEFPIALQKLRQSVSMKESSFTLHLIGHVLWKSDQAKKAFKVFVKAADLDPYFSRNYVYLGYYYEHCVNNKQKACQCYQKACDLNIYDEEAGLAYSNVLKDLGDNKANIDFLKKFAEVSNSKSCLWAWNRIGLCHLDNNSILEAIYAFQNALSCDSHCSHTWECLGDSYFRRGSFESALKAYNKAVELKPTSLYPLYQVATVQKIRGLYSDAITKYENLLSLDSSYIPAFIGQAESFFLLGKQFFNEGFYGRSRDYFQRTLNSLAKIVSANGSLLGVWKLAGDVCTYCFHLGEKWFPLTLPPELQYSHQESVYECSKKELMKFGAKFYGQALSFNPKISSLWHDLGINLFFQSKVADLLQRNDLAKRALISLQKAASISPTNHHHWTALGIISVSAELGDYALGQHSFIKSIELEKVNVEAWTNLGILYLQMENVQLANSAFKMAQSIDPTYPICWIGQAVIAAVVSDNETIDIYRHTTTLSNHPEILLGYSKVVCDIVLRKSSSRTEHYKYNIEQMNAVIVASLCAAKYVDNNDTNPEAFNIHGILLERQKLVNSALKAYEKSLMLYKAQGKSTELEIVRANYARLLSVVDNAEASIYEFLQLRKADTSLLCSFASSLYKAKKFEKAFEIFDQALQVSNSPSEKSHIYVAMATVAYSLNDASSSTVFDLLHKSSSLKPASVHGLLALWALGVLRDNTSISASMKQALEPYNNSVEFGPSIAMLCAAVAFFKKGHFAARNELLNAIIRSPNNSTLRLHLASCLLLWGCNNADLPALQAQAAVIHGGNKEKASQIFVLSRLSAGYKKMSLYAAQKAVHLSPDKLLNWVTLVAACHVAIPGRNNVGWMFSYVKQLAKEQQMNPKLLGWLVATEVFHYLYCKDLTNAQNLLKQALDITAFNTETLSALRIFNGFLCVLMNDGKLDSLLSAVKNESSNFLGWQILVRWLIGIGRFIDAKKTLIQLVTAAEKFFPQLECFPLLQLSALSYQASNVSEIGEEWIIEGQDAVSRAVQCNAESEAARFLQGLLALKTKNISLARRSFEKVVYNSSSVEIKWAVQCATDLLINIYLSKDDRNSLQKLGRHFPNNRRLIELCSSNKEENDIKL